MATAEQDYYQLLGVARDASHAQIKQAFRRLARELHPDVSDDPDAAPRFRSITEAYEVLSDPERRQLYDRFGHAGLRRGGFAPMGADFGSLSDVFAAFFGETLFGSQGDAAARPSRGPDLAAQVEIDLADVVTGTTAGTAGGVYLWQSREDAEKLYTKEWKDFIHEKYGAEPSIVYFHSPVVVDNLTKEIIKD